MKKFLIHYNKSDISIVEVEYKKIFIPSRRSFTSEEIQEDAYMILGPSFILDKDGLPWKTWSHFLYDDTAMALNGAARQIRESLERKAMKAGVTIEEEELQKLIVERVAAIKTILIEEKK